jgi:ESS family glutamate:Na+ symporter
MGATPVGVANMGAITQRLGPSPRAMLVVPLIGLAFFDVFHVFIVKWMILWLA